MRTGTHTHSFLWYVFSPKQLYDYCFKHWVSDKVHQVHLSTVSMTTKALIELSGEYGAHGCEVGWDQPSFDRIMYSTVVLEERLGGEAS